jgi:hypothetical protein
MKSKSTYKKLSKPTMEELIRKGYLMTGTTFAEKQLEHTRLSPGSRVHLPTSKKPSVQV